MLNWTERIGSVTHLLASLEYLTRGRDRQRGGANNWAVNRRTFRAHAPRATRVLDLFADQRVVTALHASRAVAAAALWLPLTNRQRVVANAVLTGSQGALHAQHLYGSDGADQVSFLVQALTTVARAGRNRPAVVDAALWFLSLQSVLSYTVSGWAKLPSETWRSGRALPAIVRTITYGDKQAWELMRRFPRLTQLTAHGVLAMECAFPLAFAAKGRPAPYPARRSRRVPPGQHPGDGAGTLLLGVHLHLSRGRLHHPSPGTAPARATVSAATTPCPPVAAAAGLALFAAGQAARIRRRRIIERGRGDEQRFVTTAGNTLSYRYAGTGPIPADGPVLLLENGLAATAEHWERIAAPLGERFTTVTYQRAGYGASRYHDTGEYRFDTMVDDLVELARHVAGDRPLVLAGHSPRRLPVAARRRTARRPGPRRGAGRRQPPRRTAALAAQAEGSRALSETLAIMPGSLRAGLGSLLPRPAWVERMPESVRDLALAQYRDPALWSAARREWEVVRERFDADTRLPHIDVPLVVSPPGRPRATDAVQAELHDEFAAAAPRAQRHTIEGADHDEILTDADHSGEVADILAAFVADVTEDSPQDDGRSQGRPGRQGRRGPQGRARDPQGRCAMSRRVASDLRPLTIGLTGRPGHLVRGDRAQPAPAAGLRPVPPLRRRGADDRQLALLRPRTRPARLPPAAPGADRRRRADPLGGDHRDSAPRLAADGLVPGTTPGQGGLRHLRRSDRLDGTPPKRTSPPPRRTRCCATSWSRSYAGSTQAGCGASSSSSPAAPATTSPRSRTTCWPPLRAVDGGHW